MATTKDRLKNDFEHALTKKLDEAFSQFPPEILQMKLRDFLALAAIPQGKTHSSDLSLPETPKTATRRSNRQTDFSSITATPSAPNSSIKATPGTRSRKALMTPQAFNPLLPQTPANTRKTWPPKGLDSQSRQPLLLLSLKEKKLCNSS